METRARLGDVASGELFAPFHFGYWDNPGRARAANEITIYGWDPVSKQPSFKYAAVKLEKIRGPEDSSPRMSPATSAPARSVLSMWGRRHSERQSQLRRVRVFLITSDCCNAANGGEKGPRSGARHPSK